jgi:deoxycytidylate deaminase
VSKKHEITALAYDKRGKLLAVGRNSYVRTHPLQAKYGRRTGRPNAVYLHAELAALVKARAVVHKLVILRYHKDGRPALAKPCPACELAIKEFGVKFVEYTK